ncbi:MAG: DUF503 domain-containing protein [Nitriliruptorales bacterium]|nr:DUF503 domain-containing protein [Nitriliruptorales bacterium]
MGSGERVHHAIVRLELHVPAATSRKDRRAVLQKVTAALRELGCSVAEIGGQETWQRIVLGLAVATSSATSLDRVLERIRPIAERDPRALVTTMAVEVGTLDADEGDRTWTSSATTGLEP